MVTVSASHSAARSAATAATAAAGPPAPASSPARAARPAQVAAALQPAQLGVRADRAQDRRAQRGRVAREVGQRQRRRVAQRPRGHEREQPALGRRLAVRERCGRHVGDRVRASRAERGVGHRHPGYQLSADGSHRSGHGPPDRRSARQGARRRAPAAHPRTSRSRTRSAACWPRTSRPTATCPRSPTARWTGSPCAPGPPGARCASSARRAPALPPTSASSDGEAVRISTGAAVPEGADAVLQVELVTDDGDTVTLDDEVDARPQRAPRGRRRQRRRDRPARRHPHRRGRDRHRGRGRPRNRVLRPPPSRRGAGDRRRAGRPRRPAGSRPAARLQRRDARGAGDAVPARACCAPTRSSDTEEATRAAIAAALEEADVLVLSRRRLGRPARPRQARAAGARRRRGLLARRAASRTPDLVRHARRRARLRPARQPGLGHGHVHALRPPGARRDAGRPARARADRVPPRRRHPAPPRPRRVRPRDPRTTASRRRPGRRARTSSARCSARTASRS